MAEEVHDERSLEDANRRACLAGLIGGAVAAVSGRALASASGMEEEQRLIRTLEGRFAGEADGVNGSGASVIERMRSHWVPGAGVAVVRHGRILWEHGFGVRDAVQQIAVTPETMFQAASISKPVTALATLRLVEQGKLDLDIDVNRCLRASSRANSRGRYGGSSSFEQPPSAATVRSAATGHQEDGTPVPTGWHVYSEQAAAGLWTTPGDLCRYVMGVQAALEGKPGAILSQRVARQMVQAQLSDGGFGLGPEVTSKVFYHGGANAGFRCRVEGTIDGALGAAVMTNGDGGGIVTKEILATIREVFGWSPD